VGEGGGQGGQGGGVHVTGEDLQRGGGETGRGVRSPVLDSPEQWGEVRILARAMRVKRNIFISSEFLLLFNFFVLSIFLVFFIFFGTNNPVFW
jgi:hypothetical protein